MNGQMGKKTNTYSITASSTPQKLCGSNPQRVGITIYNNGSVTAYITDSQPKSYAQGIPLLAGETYNNDTTTAELWIVTASSTSDIRVQEDGD